MSDIFFSCAIQKTTVIVIDCGGFFVPENRCGWRLPDSFRFAALRTFAFGCLVADSREKANHVVRRIGQQNRDPMELVHVVCGVNPLCLAERAEHFDRQLQIDDLDCFVAVEPEFPS